jgi:hypothetical protein
MLTRISVWANLAAIQYIVSSVRRAGDSLFIAALKRAYAAGWPQESMARPRRHSAIFAFGTLNAVRSRSHIAGESLLPSRTQMPTPASPSWLA